MSNNSKKPKAWINQGRIHHRDGSETRCPYCRARMDGYTSATIGGELAPEPPLPRQGQLSVCAACGEIVQFTADAHLIKADPAAIHRLDPEVRKFLLLYAEQVKADKSRN